MFNVFEWFKNRKEAPEPVSEFSIEYYPEAGKYYPTHKGKYFFLSGLTGIYELQDRLPWAKYEYSEEAAMGHIERYKEQQFKENVKIINVP